MKKLIVLSLVISMASLATAGIESLTITSVGNDVIISANGDYPGGAVDFGIELNGGAAVGSFAVSASPLTLTVLQDSNGSIIGAPWVAFATNVGAVGWAANVGAPAAQAGTDGNVLFTFTTTGTGTATLKDANTGAAGATVPVVPEPMTLGLLGLGGLFLRRKK